MTELEDALRYGVVPAAALTARLGFSPQTLMRRSREASQQVVRIGRARATRYGLRREVPALGASDVALFRVDGLGNARPVGRLVALAADQFAWLPAGAVFDGLPPEIADMRPAGFIGRAFPRRYPELNVPVRVQDWSEEHVLVALARRGEDQPGNLIVGDESIERWFANPPIAATRSDYPALADAATGGAPAGSSAAGERPKFGAYVGGEHVLVKYAAAGGGEVATRWQDLLRLEALALELLRESGRHGVRAELLEHGSHVFLEVERFDRFGARGRRAAMTLAATGVDLSASWSRAALRLLETKRFSKEDSDRLRFYEAFARCIANTDRHHFNVVLFPEMSDPDEIGAVEPKRYELAPAYDQLPMLYAPTSDGQLPPRDFRVPTPTADTWDVWNDARELAVLFWRRASELQRLSASIRAIASENADALDAAA